MLPENRTTVSAFNEMSYKPQTNKENPPHAGFI